MDHGGERLLLTDELCTTDNKGRQPPARRTSDDSDGDSQACFTLRSYEVKQFYNVVTNFRSAQNALTSRLIR